MSEINIFGAQETITFQGGDSGGYDPVDATPFYLAQTFASPALADPTPTAPTAANYAFPSQLVAATLREFYLLIIRVGTAGTTEQGTLQIRVNNTTDSQALSGLQWNGTSQAYAGTGLSIALPANSFWVPKIIPPTWVTNPTGTFYIGKAVLTYP